MQKNDSIGLSERAGMRERGGEGHAEEGLSERVREWESGRVGE